LGASLFVPEFFSLSVCLSVCSLVWLTVCFTFWLFFGSLVRPSSPHCDSDSILTIGISFCFCLLVWLGACLFVPEFFSLSVCLSVCLLVWLVACLFVRAMVWLCLPVCPSIFLSLFLSLFDLSNLSDSSDCPETADDRLVTAGEGVCRFVRLSTFFLVILPLAYDKTLCARLDRGEPAMASSRLVPIPPGFWIPCSSLYLASSSCSRRIISSSLIPWYRALSSLIIVSSNAHRSAVHFTLPPFSTITTGTYIVLRTWSLVYPLRYTYHNCNSVRSFSKLMSSKEPPFLKSYPIPMRASCFIIFNCLSLHRRSLASL